MKISIIIPVLNEATLIAPFLGHLRERAPGAEIIVVDGGSSDGTVSIAEGLADRVLITKPGRALQMNAGANIARGDILWFLHVDAEVPLSCLEEIADALTDPRVVGGFFRIRLPRSGWVYRLTDVFAHYAGLILRMRCGDHGLFCRRPIFEKIGGFPEVPLMEDVEFHRKLRQEGCLICIPRRITVSPRRYEQIGAVRLSLAFGFIALLYAMGVPLSILERIYRGTCCSPAVPDNLIHQGPAASRVK